MLKRCSRSHLVLAVTLQLKRRRRLTPALYIAENRRRLISLALQPAVRRFIATCSAPSIVQRSKLQQTTIAIYGAAELRFYSPKIVLPTTATGTVVSVVAAPLSVETRGWR